MRLTESGPVGDAVREALQTVASKGKPFAPGQSPVNGLSGLPNRNAPSVAASESQLSELSTMLAGGAKQEAVQFASEVGLWSHALIIASSVDPDLWAETVSRFAAAELAHMGGATSGLRAAYALFSGATPRTGWHSHGTWHSGADDQSMISWQQPTSPVIPHTTNGER